MQLKELYQQPVQQTTLDLDAFHQVSGHHFNEELPNSRVEIRILQHIYIDGRRYWELATVWFDNKPFGVIQRAGREGRDHREAFWTDADIFAEALLYLYSLVVVHKENKPKITSLEFNESKLVDFYGYCYLGSLGATN
jgi:hypothetical protein